METKQKVAVGVLAACVAVGGPAMAWLFASLSWVLRGMYCAAA